MSERCIFKIRKFELDSLRRFRMVEEKHEALGGGGGGGVIRLSPGKIGLRGRHEFCALNTLMVNNKIIFLTTTATFSVN